MFSHSLFVFYDYLDLQSLSKNVKTYKDPVCLMHQLLRIHSLSAP